METTKCCFGRLIDEILISIYLTFNNVDILVLLCVRIGRVMKKPLQIIYLQWFCVFHPCQTGIGESIFFANFDFINEKRGQ